MKVSEKADLQIEQSQIKELRSIDRMNRCFTFDFDHDLPIDDQIRAKAAVLSGLGGGSLRSLRLRTFRLRRERGCIAIRQGT